MGSEEGYNKELENDIKSDLYGNLEPLLVSILQCKRSENNNPNQNEWQKLAQELVNAGEKKWELILLFFIKYLQDVHMLKYHILIDNIIKFKVIIF